MPEPLVSIIIPCYNAAQYVGAAIQSALDQTYPHKEVIVVDDGSTDGGLERIQAFGDSVQCETGPNRGGCAARNRGLERAKGAFVQFLDADDLLHPEKVARQAPWLLADGQSLVFCDCEVRNADLTEVAGQHRRAFDPGDDPVVYMLRGGLPTQSPLHWRHNLLAVGGFRAGLPCGQERDLHLRLACAGIRFVRVPDFLAVIRQRRGSVSSDSVRVLDQHADMVWRAHDALESAGVLTEARAAALAGLLAHDARAYLNHGLIEKSRDYFEQAARLHADGGIPQAYSGRTRLLRRVLGPTLTQRLVGVKRSILPGR